jgi:two-component system, OmpR family, response regulator
MTNSQINILIVEDDKNMGFLLLENIRNDGYNATLCINGKEGLLEFLKNKYDLCLLDIMMPKQDGLSLAKSIRETDNDVPIIFLTARTLDMDKIAGFKAGCDDYLTKPFNIEELLLRIKALLKRSRREIGTNTLSILEFGDTKFNNSDRTIELNGVMEKLSTREAGLVRILAENKNKVVSRTMIMQAVWQRDDYFTSKNLDVYLTKLRKLIHRDKNLELQNIHGYGYKLIEKH